MAHRIRFDGHFFGSPALAQTRGNRAEIDVLEMGACMRSKETVTALVDLVGTNKTCARKACRRHTSDRRPSGVDALVPRAILPMFGDCRRRAARKTLCVRELIGVQA